MSTMGKYHWKNVDNLVYCMKFLKGLFGKQKLWLIAGYLQLNQFSTSFAFLVHSTSTFQCNHVSMNSAHWFNKFFCQSASFWTFGNPVPCNLFGRNQFDCLSWWRHSLISRDKNTKVLLHLPRACLCSQAYFVISRMRMCICHTVQAWER